jgi:hypothetical protein
VPSAGSLVEERISEIESVATEPCETEKPKGKKMEKNVQELLVAHACNPSYSGGRDQEDCSSKPACANSLRDPILKNTQHRTGLVEWLKV